MNDLKPPFLRNGGELAQRIADYPWHLTPLGPIPQWPSHVRHTVATMLNSAVEQARPLIESRQHELAMQFPSQEVQVEGGDRLGKTRRPHG
jgi:hypothetical protein